MAGQAINPVAEKLQNFYMAQINQRQGFDTFLKLAQAGNFEEAGKWQLYASAMFDTMCDLFMDACRTSERQKGINPE